MPTDDTAQVEVRTQEEVTRPDLRASDTQMEGGPGEAEATDATGFRELAAFLDAEARAAAAPGRKAECLWARGRVELERLADGRAALAGFRAAFEQDPGFVPNLISLRQLWWARGNWSGVLETLEAELRAASEPEARAELALAAGRVFEEKLANPEAARKWYQRALELQPGHRAATAFLTGLEERLEDPAELAAAYERAVAASGDRALRSLFLEATARLREARREATTEDNEAAAMQLDALALREDPTNAAARRALKRLYHKHGRWAELCEVLLTEADLAVSDPARVVAYYLAGRVLHQRLGQSDRALDIYRRALAIAPDDPLVLGEVAELCTTLGRWDEAYAAVERMARSGGDERLRATLHLRAGRIAEERLADDERALSHYGRAMELDPRGPASAALGRLYARLGIWHEQARLLVAEADLVTDSHARAAFLYKAGEIVFERLGAPENAASLMTRALAAEPGFLPAVVLLERLYRALERWPELAELYETELARSEDGQRRAELLEALAELHGTHTGDLPRATAALSELRKLGAAPAAGARATRALLATLERTGRWREAALATVELAQAARDPRQAASLWHRAAEIWEEHVGDAAQAALCHRRTLEVVPTYLPSLRALGRAGVAQGQIGEAAAALARELELATVPETRAGLHYRLGELHESAGQVELAIADYREATAVLPGYAPALAALERLYRALGDHARLCETLMTIADLARDPLEKATALHRAGQVLEELLDDPAAAADAYAHALAVVADHAPSLEALERLFVSGERWTELADVRRRAAQAAVDDAARIAAFCALADLLWRRLGDADGAVLAYQRALQIDAHDVGALRQLECVLLQTGRWEPLVEVYERLAERADEPEAQVALWRRAAAVRESREQPPGDPAPLYERVLEAPTRDRAAWEALDRLYSERADMQGLLRVLEARLEAAPARERRAWLLRLAAAHEGLGNLEEAIVCCERAVEADPECVPAVRELRRLRELTGDLGGLLAALEREAEASSEPRSQVMALARAATIAMARFRDEERVGACLRRAVEIDPNDDEVGTRLEQLYERRGEWEHAAELLERRAAGQKDCVPLLIRLAEVYRDRLDKPAPAIEVLRRVVALEPNHVASLIALGDLHATLGAWPEAVAAYGRAVAVGDDAQTLRGVHLKLGEIWEQRLGDVRRAVSCFQNVLALDLIGAATPPDKRLPEAVLASVSALERLAGIFTRERDWPSAADVLARLLAIEPDAARAVEHELRLAEIYASGYGDPRAAIAVYRRALMRDPMQEAAVRGLAEVCARAGDFATLAATLVASAETLPPAESTMRAERRLRAAEVYDEQLGTPEEAARLYRSILDQNPDHVEARGRLARVLGRRLGRAEEAMREHRAVLAADPVRADSYRELRRLYERAGDHDRALWAAQALRSLRVADELEERYLRERRARAPREPQGTLAGELFDRALVHPGEQHPGRALLAALVDVLPRLYPGRLEDWGVGRNDRLTRLDDPVRALVDRMVRTLGVDIPCEIYVSRTRPKEADLESGEPPMLIVGAGFMTSVPASEQRFLLGRALTRLLTRSFTVRRMTPLDLEILLTGAVRLVQPKFGAQVAPDDTLSEMGRRITRLLPRRSRRLFEEAAEAYAAARPPRHEAWLRAMDHTANRGGLLLGNDLGVALEVLRRGDRRMALPKSPDELAAALRQNLEAAELLRFAMSDDFFALRRGIGL